MRIQSSNVGCLASDFNLEDKNDCAIRAIANVSFLKRYPDFRQRMMELGRRLNRGTQWHIIDTVYRENGASSITLWGKAGQRLKHLIEYNHVNEGITLANFIKRHPKGRYVVLVRGHALALINGEIVDTINNRAGKRVMASYHFGA